MAYTAQVLINAALVKLGILEQGGVPSASDSAECLADLNDMIQQWHLQNKFIWQVVSTNWSLVANTAIYTIGTGGTFNGPRPTAIEAAYISFVGPGTHLITSRLNMLTVKEYNDISDLSATAELPQGLYYDHASPLGSLYLYPIPRVTVATSLQLLTWAQLSQYATLATSADLPDGYSEAIKHALCLRLMPMYGVAVSSELGQLISALALQAEKTITDLNARNRGMTLDPPEAAPPEAQ